MGRLVAEGLMTAQGNTKARHYKLKPLVDFLLPLERKYAIGMKMHIWRENIRPLADWC